MTVGRYEADVRYCTCTAICIVAWPVDNRMLLSADSNTAILEVLRRKTMVFAFAGTLHNLLRCNGVERRMEYQSK